MALCERRNPEYYPTLDHENLCLSVVCGLGQRRPRGRFAQEYRHWKSKNPRCLASRPRTTHVTVTVQYRIVLFYQGVTTAGAGAPPPSLSDDDDTVFPNPDRLTGFKLLLLTGTIVSYCRTFVCMYSSWREKEQLTMTRPYST